MTEVEMVNMADDPAEWSRRFDEYMNTASEVYEEFERESIAITPPIMGPHGALFGLRHPEYCTCYVGAACEGRANSSARTDIDGPYTDQADLFVFTGADPAMIDDEDDGILVRWIELGRPHEHHVYWWFGYYDYYPGMDFEHVARHAEGQWDRVRAEQAAHEEPKE